VDVLRDGTHDGIEQPRGKRESHHESLLPASDDSVATVLAGLVDFALAFPVLFALMWRNGVVPTANVVWLPVFIALAFATALGVDSPLRSMSNSETSATWCHSSRSLMFATPIAYPSSLLPEKWRTLYALNPMVGVVEGSGGPARHSDATGANDCGICCCGTGAAGRRRVLLPAHGATFADVV
jgi:ABC-type polysaccharide/polyol phosphate export permease